MTARLEIGETDFLLDGRPHRIISGALHYFRVHPGQWADRIRTARLMGLNTIETYVAWNAHEPARGEWSASDGLDLGRFLDLVAAEGMHAIVRPGPYICAEWTNGGLPAWLTAMPGIGLRRSEPVYVDLLSEYLRRVYEIVAPRQIDRGGNVILVQIENEYGAYGSDKEYLAELVRVTRDAGITVPLTTIDQPVDRMLADGSLPGLHLTGSFGSRATERLATLRSHQQTGPLMCAEFWDGWFDWWGSVHHTTTPVDSARELDALLAAGASVNFYMVHGGTNFGLTSGANHKGRYLPITTSYDYDAPIDEAGRPTEKFWAFREVISRYAPVPDEVPDAGGPAPVFDVELVGVGDFVGAGAVGAAAAGAGSPARATAGGRFEMPPSFEDLAHTSALVRYEVSLLTGAEPDPHETPSSRHDPDILQGSRRAGGVLRKVEPGAALRRLEVGEVRDRAWIEVDGIPVGALSRTHGERSLAIPDGARLSVLVEERGRVNYDVRIGEQKGLIGPVLLDGVELRGWDVTPIDVEAIGTWALDAPTNSAVGRTALRGGFALDAPSDLFLDTSGWGCGFAFVNGFLLGRYDRTGPQRTLYVPASVVRRGDNTIVVVELADAADPVARFVATPDLGPREE